MKYLIFLISLTFIYSCVSTKSPTGFYSYGAILKTCVTDSSALHNSSTIELIFGHKKINDNCQNKPDFYDKLFMWPSNLNLNFKTKSYISIYNPHKIYKDNKQDFNIAYDHDFGKLRYDKKNQTISFNSDLLNWTKTYKVIYSKSDSTMTLIEIKNAL